MTSSSELAWAHSVSLSLQAMTSERTLILHGIAKCPSWYWSSAVQLEMFLNLPCRLRQRMANSANSSSKQMQMNATYMAGRISSHVFQNVYMNSKHVSFFYTHGAWKVVLASGCWSVRFKLSGPPWQLHVCKERRRLNSKVWSLRNSCCGMVTSCSFFLSPFPWIVKVCSYSLRKFTPLIIA